jgi:WD40 repeat protein
MLCDSIASDATTEKSDAHCNRLKTVLGTIAKLSSSLPALAIASLLQLQDHEVVSTLFPLHSVVDVPDEPDMPVRLHHASVRDFLLSDRRCEDKRFRVDEKKAHADLAKRCLNFMDLCLKRDMCGLQDPCFLKKDIDMASIDACFPSQLRYACKFWVQHVQRGDQVAELEELVTTFLQKHLLHWFEVLNMLRCLSDGIRMITLLKSLPVSLPKLSSVAEDIANSHVIQWPVSSYLRRLVHDAKRFAISNMQLIEEAHRQVYLSAVLFAPQSSLVRGFFVEQLPRVFSRLPLTRRHWSNLMTVLEGHRDWIRAVSFSPCGRLISSASLDKIMLWDARTGAARGILHSNLAIFQIAEFSPDRQRLVSASFDGTIQLWDAATTVLVATLHGHTRRVNAVVFSADGRLLALASNDKTVRLWCGTSGNFWGLLQGHEEEVLSVVFSPDGQLLVSSSLDSTVRLWSHWSQTLLRTFDQCSVSGSGAAFSPDGLILATAQLDGRVMLFYPLTQTALGDLSGHRTKVTALAFSPNKKLFASASDDRAVKLWDVASRRMVRTIIDVQRPHYVFNWIVGVVFSPDSRLRAVQTVGRSCHLWDVESGALWNDLRNHTGRITTASFSPDAQVFAAPALDATIWLWDVGEDVLSSRSTDHDPPVGAIPTKPLKHSDGITRGMTALSRDAPSELLPAPHLDGLNDAIVEMVFSPDGHRLSAVGKRFKLRLWNAATGHILPLCQNFYGGASFSPDSRLLAIRHNGDRANMWSANDGSFKYSLVDGLNVLAVAFTPNGQRLIFLSHNRTLGLCDAGSGARISTLRLGAASTEI